MAHAQGTCPVCNGTGRVPVPENQQRWKTVMASYDKETDTLGCRNCGGQYMFGMPSGKTNLRADGTPCEHEYESANLGRCYTGYVCKHCGDHYTIDSSD